MTWTCSACGADNDDALQFCSDCGGERAGDVAVPKPLETDKPEDKTFEDNTFEDKTVLPEPSPEPEHMDEADEETDLDETEEEDAETAPPPSTVISSPLSAIETSPQAPTVATGQERYYLTFVNTPARSLVKSKVPVEFDVFPVITIGRSPENVVVIPDQEVSRKHAELTAEGSRLVLKDLKSKNGTFVYDGKTFKQVTDSVEVKPNSILKFGTGTIVRLVTE